MPRPAAGKNGNTHAGMSREDIADHIAAFRKRGGRIEVLGTTPLRTTAPAAFRSRATVQRQTQARATGKTGG
ncbi:hypothetical protein D0Y53_06980 [Luteimonas weifangensis]|uniref:Uncharacterized protein n=1 Tax=Cognatiluteimonas weifangensis TaxID=2303539 RepID=A0A372DMR7_9GAMM|nr:hypothetical protein D0Y53_06980 [Luteimonas weifangensis]